MTTPRTPPRPGRQAQVTNPDHPPVEPATVQLTRMEGVLNLINFQLTELARTVADHGGRLGIVEIKVQRLKDAAEADKITVAQTAAALKDAKEATEAATRADLEKSNQSWSPVSRLLAVTAGLSSLVAFYFAIRPGG